MSDIVKGYIIIPHCFGFVVVLDVVYEYS